MFQGNFPNDNYEKYFQSTNWSSDDASDILPFSNVKSFISPMKWEIINDIL